MGIICDLAFSHKFLYQVELDNNLIEHEWDHLLIGQYDGEPRLNEDEAMAWKYMALEEVKRDPDVGRGGPNSAIRGFEKVCLPHGGD